MLVTIRSVASFYLLHVDTVVYDVYDMCSIKNKTKYCA